MSGLPEGNHETIITLSIKALLDTGNDPLWTGQSMKRGAGRHKSQRESEGYAFLFPFSVIMVFFGCYSLSGYGEDRF